MNDENTASAPTSEFRLEVDRGRCEAKAACVAVCPNDVFEVGPISDADFNGLSLLGKLKSWVHGRRTAYAVRAQDCSGCARCVSACPERAITMTPSVSQEID